MNNIIVAFPKEELARNIKKILAQSGYSVIAVCTTGASALEHVNGMDSGILVCGYGVVDMMYLEIYEYLPKGFQMLLIASLENVSERGMDNLVTLATPLKVHELLQTIEMMDYTVTRYKKKQRQRPKIRSDEEQQTINRAKALLMDRNDMTEDEAHKYIQRRSMENGTGLVEISHMILSLMQD